MKKAVVFIFSSMICTALHSQNLILNGSFENNTATGNTLNLTSGWSTIVSDCFEVDGGSMDLITSNNCGIASDGNWYTTCSPQSGTWPYLAFSFKLNSTLILGAQYTLTFDKRYCGPNSSAIDIGISNDSTITGTPVHTFLAPLTNNWTQETYVFQAMLAAKYLTVNIGVTGSTGIVGVDNFSLQAGVVAITELADRNFILFFNPSNSVLSVSFSSIVHKKNIEIFNAIGERIYSANLKQQTSKEINLAELSTGIYFVKIYDGERIYSEKILIF